MDKKGDPGEGLQKRLEQFLALDDEGKQLAFLQKHADEMLTAEAAEKLAELMEAAEDEGERERLSRRLQLVQKLREMKAIAELPPEERLFRAFLSTRHAQEMSHLALMVEAGALDKLEQMAEARAADAERDEKEGIEERLADLRQIRGQLQAEYGELLPTVRLLNQWIGTDTWEESEAFLRQRADDLLTGEAERALRRLLEKNPDNRTLNQHEVLLRESRGLGIDQAYANRAERSEEEGIDPERAQELADRLIAWIQKETLGEAEAYLREHEEELVTEEGMAVIEMLVQANAGNPTVQDHRRRLARAREAGVPAMYAEILLRRRQEALQEAGPIGTAVQQFIQLEEDDQAEALLQSQGDLLMTWDAGNLLRGLAEASAKAEDDELAARLETRYRQWYAARIGGGDTAQTLQSEAEQQQQQLAAEESGAKYEIGTAAFTAIGDDAVTINLLNFRAVTLKWKRPQMARRDLTEKAIGRADELQEIHGQLLSERGDTAVVGKGRSGAVRGMPGVGKSTLAALYGRAYADAYPGGVLWLQLGPSYQTEESVLPEISRMAALAYSGDTRRFQLDLPQIDPQTLEQIQRTLQNAIFTPEAVQRLLAGHGRLLVIADDVWSRRIVPAIRRALPAEAHLLVTTRDNRVAGAVGQSLALDVLGEEDALALIRQSIPMGDGLARRLMRVVGAHPMALQIALGDLNPEDPPAEWAEAVDVIEERLARGMGVDPTVLDDVEPMERLSAILPYSYDGLAASDGLQRCFRALGAFAREAEFTTEAVASVCQFTTDVARSLLRKLRDRNLLRRQDDPDRWHQHTILRSYALEQQTKAEQYEWAERHATYYLEAARRADDAQRYYELAPELPNLRRAFTWAVGEGRALALAQGLLSNCANLLRSQNLGAEYLAWARQAVKLADTVGGAEERGRALGSLGNALQSAATVVPGEDRAARLKEALAAYDEALELRQDVPLDYATTQNNRANLLRELASLPGADRAARLKEAVADISSALETFQQVQQMQYLHIGRQTLARLMAAMGPAAFGAAWSEVARRAVPRLPGQMIASALAQEAAISSDAEFRERLERDPEFRRQLDDLISFAGAAPDTPDAPLGEAKNIADQLVAWVQTPDWTKSQVYLEQHAGQLLTDEAEGVLLLLQESNPDNESIPLHQTLLKRCREIGIEQAYEELNAAMTAAQDPVLAAIQKLLQVKDAETFEQTIEEHPALRERPALEKLTALVEQAHDEEQPEMALQLLSLLIPLLQIYNHEHSDRIDPEEHTPFIDLHESLLPFAEASGTEELVAGLRRSLSWALHTLGNHYAEHREHAKAIETYTRAIGQEPQNAMIYRNRAGEYIERQRFEQAQADIEQAERLEPDAARLPRLWCELYLARGDGEALLAHAKRLRDRDPDDGDGPFYVALAHALTGNAAEAEAAMETCSQMYSEQQQEQGLKMMAKVGEEQPEHTAILHRLETILSNPGKS